MRKMFYTMYASFISSIYILLLSICTPSTSNAQRYFDPTKVTVSDDNPFKLIADAAWEIIGTLALWGLGFLALGYIIYVTAVLLFNKYY